MSNEKFSKEQEEMIRQMKKVNSKGDLLKGIPDDMKKRLDEVLSNENELKRILSSERAKALYDIIKEEEKGGKK